MWPWQFPRARLRSSVTKRFVVEPVCSQLRALCGTHYSSLQGTAMNTHHPNTSHWAVTTACITWKENDSKHRLALRFGSALRAEGSSLRTQCHLSQTLVKILSAVLACIKHPGRHGVSMSVSPSHSFSTQARREQEPQPPADPPQSSPDPAVWLMYFEHTRNKV